LATYGAYSALKSANPGRARLPTQPQLSGLYAYGALADPSGLTRLGARPPVREHVAGGG
jgi:hypothetical protein